MRLSSLLVILGCGFMAHADDAIITIADPFSLIYSATEEMHKTLPAAVFLTVHTKANTEQEGCRDQGWEFVFNDHKAKKTGFVTIYEQSTSDGCALATTSELAKNYPWVGVKEMEPLFAARAFSYEEALKRVGEKFPDGKLIRVEIYRPQNPFYSGSIYGRFVYRRSSDTKGAYFNFMTGAVE